MDLNIISTSVLLTILQATMITAKSRVTSDLDIANDSSYETEKRNLSNIASIFSPRMDFDQWKPLTGRGDPLRNDPTYDYEPPLLERVHYWADDTRLEREHYPERKSEVLMLGVSSRRPSMGSRQQPMVPRRQQRPPPKYEDNKYKLSDPFPMTILVPPPPPPPGLQSLYALFKDKMPIPATHPKPTTQNFHPTEPTLAGSIPEHVTAYTVQESNLIYQASTTNVNNWINPDSNKTYPISNAVSSDYAGWGPTTPIDDASIANETHNLISYDQLKFNDHPYSFYKPMLSGAPPPPQITLNPLLLPTFVPTAPPPTVATQSGIINITQSAWIDKTTTENVRDLQDYYDETTTERQTTYQFEPTPNSILNTISENGVLDMLGPMMSMPLVNGPERLEDNLYAHASDNVQVYKEQPPEDASQIETMQTMQPPPPEKPSKTTIPQPNQLNQVPSSLKKPTTHTHDPYLHMRFTTPMPTATSIDNVKSTTESPSIPMYLIIQGHSKVKTYSSKPIFNDVNDTTINEIPKPNETTEVKHLHTIQVKREKVSNRTSKSHSNLKALVDNGLGSIEIQETDLGIKYDVSDGSDVPLEIYRKGIVDSDENAYAAYKKTREKRYKRQIELEDLMPFDEDSMEEYVYNFLKGKRNETGITGLIAQAVTSDAAKVVDELEDDEDEDDEER